MFTFLELQTEVKERAIRNQGGTAFDSQIKNTINTSLFRISRECPWKVLRRKAIINTEGEQITGTVNATINSSSFTGTGLNLITNNIRVGRRIQITGSQQNFIINTITGQNAFTTNLLYSGPTATGLTYKIFGTEEYNLPYQVGKVGLVWHEDYGYPTPLEFLTDYDFYDARVTIDNSGIPLFYRTWGEDSIIEQPLEPSILRVFSSSGSDTSKNITIFGTVMGFPDFETIITNSTNGTTPVFGLKSFSQVERVSKDTNVLGRITIDCNSGNTTVATLPVGSSTGTIPYKKIQVFPLPQTSFPINVQYYKEPWELVNDSDMHELGQEFDEAIILLATSKLKFAQNQAEGTNFYQLFQEEVKTLRRTNMDRNLDWYPVLKRPKDSRRRNRFWGRGVFYTQLGGMYGPMAYR